MSVPTSWKVFSLRLLEELDLLKYFGSVVGPDTIGIAKPDPRPFHESVSRLGRKNPRAIMIGDSETDILTARNAGVPVIAFPSDIPPSMFRPSGRTGDRPLRRGLGRAAELFAQEA